MPALGATRLFAGMSVPGGRTDIAYAPAHVRFLTQSGRLLSAASKLRNGLAHCKAAVVAGWAASTLPGFRARTIVMPTGDQVKWHMATTVDYFFAPALKFDVPISLRLRDVRGGHARQLERCASWRR